MSEFYEAMPELPQEVDRSLGELIMNLSINSGNGPIYIDIYPIDPSNPNCYTADISIGETNA